MLILVALCAIAIGVKQMHRRSAYYAERARYHRQRGSVLLKFMQPEWMKIAEATRRQFEERRRGIQRIAPVAPSLDPFSDDEFRLAVLLRVRRNDAYHDAMADKYEDAADRPWITVPPDPPEPY